jgi:hypothetical protein
MVYFEIMEWLDIWRKAALEVIREQWNLHYKPSGPTETSVTEVVSQTLTTI